MRIRSIKPEFWRSQDISCLAIEDRLLFIGLWSYVDDNGVGEDRVPMIAADLFADDIERDPSETFARVSRGLARLSEGGQIIRYTVAGRDYFEIREWKKHQRIDKPGKARLPHHSAEGSTIRECSRDIRESLAPGTGNREQGTGDQGAGNSLSSSDAGASDSEEFSPEVHQLSELLATLVRGNGHKVETVGVTWWRACDRLMRLDGYTPDQIAWIIRWATSDEFWQANIRSMPKLREKFSTLVARSNARTGGTQPSKSDEAHDFISRLEAIDAVSGGGEAVGDYPQLRQ